MRHACQCRVWGHSRKGSGYLFEEVPVEFDMTFIQQYLYQLTHQLKPYWMVFVCRVELVRCPGLLRTPLHFFSTGLFPFSVSLEIMTTLMLPWFSVLSLYPPPSPSPSTAMEMLFFCDVVRHLTLRWEISVDNWDGWPVNVHPLRPPSPSYIACVLAFGEDSCTQSPSDQAMTIESFGLQKKYI